MNPETHFLCESCGEIFERGWDEEEMLAEMKDNGWADLPVEERAVVCDDCYQQMKLHNPPAAFNARQRGG